MAPIEGSYRPTTEDFLRIKPKPDKLKVSGDGVFATLQGEGKTAGLPAVFIRLHFCNLTCGIPSGWECDTQYTWNPNKAEFWQEPEDWSIDDAVSRIDNAWAATFSQETPRRLVITGGEPLLQQNKIVDLLKMLPDWQVEIETNGTIMPVQELTSVQFNCSPKLENSGNPEIRRFHPDVLKAINQLNSQFKFVVSSPADLDEVKEIAKECELDPRKIFIMPEGLSREAVGAHASLIADAVSDNNWRITLRNQLIWYGPKRRT